MASAADQKIEWNLGETITWLRTRDHRRVSDLWDASEFEAVSRALFDRDLLPKIEPPTIAPQTPGLLHPTEAAAATVGEGSGRGATDGRDTPDQPVEAKELEALILAVLLADIRQRRQSPPLDSPPADRILQAVMRNVQTRRVRMTLIKDDERVPVSAEQASELGLRIIDDRLAPVVACSRTQRAPIGTSPWFSRSDVIRAWPERSRRTAAVAVAILRHLMAISSPEAPLTKDKAWQRCLEEVPNAYPEAFKKAWAQLEPIHKRGVGKHGPRTH